MFCSIFHPYPGTHSYEICNEKGWLTDRRVSSYFEEDYAVNQPTITRKQVLFFHSIFHDLVRHPRLAPLIELLHRIPVAPGKSMWNAIRRMRAKAGEFAARLAARPKPARNPTA